MGDWDQRVPMNNVGGIRVQGGTYPARIWAAFMQPAHDNLPVVEFTPPDDKQWPRAQSIDEFGRSEHSTVRRSQSRSASPTTAAGETPPTGVEPPVATDPTAPVEPVPPVAPVNPG
jgi:membrane peptidoglycan carboxypeptidase